MDYKVVSRAVHEMKADVALSRIGVHRTDPTCKVVVQQLNDLDLAVEENAAVHGMEAAVKRCAIHIHGMEAGAFVEGLSCVGFV